MVQTLMACAGTLRSALPAMGIASAICFATGWANFVSGRGLIAARLVATGNQNLGGNVVFHDQKSTVTKRIKQNLFSGSGIPRICARFPWPILEQGLVATPAIEP